MQPKDNIPFDSKKAGLLRAGEIDIFRISALPNPRVIHRYALESSARLLHQGDVAAALSVVRGFFAHVRDELKMLAVDKVLSLSFMEIPEVSTSERIRLAQTLPEISPSQAHVTLAPYRELLAQAYHLGAACYSALGLDDKAALGYKLESIELRAMKMNSEAHLLRQIECFFKRCVALIKATDFEELSAHLTMGQRFCQGLSENLLTHTVAIHFEEQLEAYAKSLTELTGMVKRLDALELASAHHSYDPYEVELSSREILDFAQQRMENGVVIPVRLLERAYLLNIAALYRISMLEQDEKSIQRCLHVLSAATDSGSSPGMREMFGIVLNACKVLSQTPIDDTVYELATRHLVKRPKFVTDTLVQAAANTGAALVTVQEYKLAKKVYECMESMFVSLNATLSLQAAIVHLNISDVAFCSGSLGLASAQASHAQAVSHRLSKAEASAGFYEGQAFLRLGYHDHTRLSRVPELIARIPELIAKADSFKPRPAADEGASLKRNQIWGIDLRPELEHLGMGSAWEMLNEVYREYTGCDQILSLSGKHVPGTRVSLSMPILEQEISRRYLRQARDSYVEARQLLRGQVPDDLLHQINGALAQLQQRDRGVPQLKLPSIAMVA